MNNDMSMQIARVKATAHPLRLRVLALLKSERLCVCEVAEVLQVPISSASEALRDLRRVGVLSEQKSGRWVFITLCQPPSPLIQGLLLEAQAIPEILQDQIRIAEMRDIGALSYCEQREAQLRFTNTSEHYPKSHNRRPVKTIF